MFDTVYGQLIVLVEGDGASMTSDEAVDVDDDGLVDMKDEAQSPHKPATTTAAADASQTSSLAQSPSTEDLSVKKKPQSRIAALVQRTPAAGRSE